MDEGWIEELMAFDRQVGAEDRVLVERVQRGVRSALIPQGACSPRASSSLRGSGSCARLLEGETALTLTQTGESGAALAPMESARTCPLMAIRNRLENYVVRSTTELLGDLPENRQSELGDLLGQMEGRGESFVEAETRIEELLARLEQRSTAVTALEAELSS